MTDPTLRNKQDEQTALLTSIDGWLSTIQENLVSAITLLRSIAGANPSTGELPARSLYQAITELTDALYTQTTPRIPYLLQNRTELESLNALLTSLNLADALYTQSTPRIPYLNQIAARLAGDETAVEYLARINSALGGPPFESLEIATVRGLLAAIQQSTVRVFAPGATEENALFSERMSRLDELQWIVGDACLTRIWWPNAGGTFGDIIIDSPVSLFCEDWSQYQIWVETDGARAYGWLNSVGFLEEYPSGSRWHTGQWNQLTGSGTRIFFVDGNEEIRAAIMPFNAENPDPDPPDPPDPGNLLPNPPASNCATVPGEYVRATDWKLIGTRDGLNVWRPVFSSSSGLVLASGTTNPVYGGPVNQFWRYCLEWNFTGMTVNGTGFRGINVNPLVHDTSTFYSGVLGYTGVDGSNSWDLEPNSFVVWNFGFPIAEGKPPLNIWCKATAT